jgi:hypothetical protein
MNRSQIQNKTMLLLPLVMAGFLILSLFVFSSSTYRVIAAGKFTIDARINLKKLDNPQKLKVIASANGYAQVKNVTGIDLNSKSTSVSFEFNEKNDVVNVGDRDEYFACAYALNGTNQMESYSCVEGNIENTNGINIANIGSGERRTLSTGSFQTVDGPQITNPTIRVWIPLSDRKDVKDLKVVAMIKGEFESKTINAKELLKKSEHNTIIVPFEFDKTPEIGPIQKGDLFFACVSADELNPPEGTECEHRETSHTGHIHNLVAR